LIGDAIVAKAPAFEAREFSSGDFDLTLPFLGSLVTPTDRQAELMGRGSGDLAGAQGLEGEPGNEAGRGQGKDEWFHGAGSLIVA
jgi:hypothetical protein